MSLADRCTYQHEETDTCTQCDRTLDFEQFLIEMGEKVKKMAYCTECHARILEKKEKRCKTCRQYKPLTEFEENKTSIDGHRHMCFTCAGGSTSNAAPVGGGQVIDMGHISTEYLKKAVPGYMLSKPDRDARNAKLRSIGFQWKKMEDGKFKLIDKNGVAWTEQYAVAWMLQNSGEIEDQKKRQRLEACKSAYEVMQKDVVFLDSETTGLHDLGEIIDIAVIDKSGDVLLDTLISCDGPIMYQAQATHGITMDMLEDEPMFTDVWPVLCEFLRGKTIVIYNAAFDMGRLRYMAQRHELTMQNWTSHDAMADYTKWCGEEKMKKLSAACEEFKINDISFHRALADAEACRRVMLAMAQKYSDYLERQEAKKGK